MLHPVLKKNINLAGAYSTEYLMHFSNILTAEMYKINSSLDDEDRQAFSKERIHHSMLMDLPRLKYFVHGELVSVPGDCEASLLKLEKALITHRCFWFIQYLEELSSILHQGMIKSIYEAKSLCRQSSWHPKQRLMIDLLSIHKQDKGVSFCILQEKKVILSVASNIVNILTSDHSIILTDPLTSRFETSLFISFIPIHALNHYGSQLRALSSETESMGYMMQLHPL